MSNLKGGVTDKILDHKPKREDSKEHPEPKRYQTSKGQLEDVKEEASEMDTPIRKSQPPSVEKPISSSAPSQTQPQADPS